MGKRIMQGIHAEKRRMALLRYVAEQNRDGVTDSDKDLSARFDISVPQIRRYLASLKREGMIYTKRRRQYLAEYGRWANQRWIHLDAKGLMETRNG